MVTSTIDWTRAAIVGAIAGGAFWAAAVYTLIATEGRAAAWITVAVIAVASLVVGAILYRRADQPRRRCYGAGLALAPLTGLVPVAVFSAAGVLVEVGAWG